MLFCSTVQAQWRLALAVAPAQSHAIGIIFAPLHLKIHIDAVALISRGSVFSSPKGIKLLMSVRIV